MYNSGNAPYFIPLVWNIDDAPPETSPGGNSRYWWYPGDGYIPFNVIGGDQHDVASNMAAMQSAYNTAAAVDSPLEINLVAALNGDQTSVSVTATVNVTGNVTTTQNKFSILLVRHHVNSSADYVYLVSDSSGEADFTLTTPGETMTETHTFDYDPSWDMEDVRVVAYVQTHEASRWFLQAAMTDFASLTAMFTANVTSGPPALDVQFMDSSIPQGSIVSWEWDLDGDGTIDDTSPAPFHTYDEPGSYDVSLTVSDGTDFHTTTMEDFITVTSPDDVSGAVSGTWSPGYGTYFVSDDLIIPEDGALTIEAGTEVMVLPGAKIQVNGQLDAEGTMEQPVTFAPFNVADGWHGIEIRFAQGTSTFSFSEITGAVHSAFKIENAPVEIFDCIIHDNHSSGNEAAALHMLAAGEVEVARSIISNNSSSGTDAPISMYASTPLFSNNLIVNNECGVAGAITIKSGSAPVFVNSTIANNHCTGSSGSTVFLYQGEAQFINSIIWSTDAEADMFSSMQSTLDVTYSCVMGGQDGEGNIADDPMFLEPSAEVGNASEGMLGNWRLQSTSPCVDAGNPDAMYNDVEDPDNPGYAMFPGLGTVTADMGCYGGDYNAYYSTGADDDSEEIVPLLVPQISIAPNPFNPETKIVLSIPQGMENLPAHLEIYNIRGQKVRTLMNGEPAGLTRSMVWNSRDDNGTAVASGVYFTRLLIGQSVITRKMVLMK